jgi:uncharacterized membrane protein YbhN (UPF0104 family)
MAIWAANLNKVLWCGVLEVIFASLAWYDGISQIGKWVRRFLLLSLLESAQAVQAATNRIRAISKAQTRNRVSFQGITICPRKGPQ